MSNASDCGEEQEMQPQLIALEELELEEVAIITDEQQPEPEPNQEKDKDNEEVAQKQKQQQRKMAKKGGKNNKARQQREAKQRALAQHARRRRAPRRQLDEEHEKWERENRRSWQQHGFVQWLAYLQAKWRRLRREAKLAADSRDSGPIGSDQSTVVGGSLMASLAGGRKESVWHVIQILETKLPGQFTMFALVDPSGSDMLLMRRVNLTVPRTIYVDDIEPRQTAVGQLVEKLLPRMRVPANLYEFPIDEALFAARMAELNVQMCQMRINGVYETRVPLLFKAIAHCGVLCHVGTRRNPTELALDTITRVEHPLDSSSSSNRSQNEAVQQLNLDRLRPIFFYEYSHAGRSVSALFMPRMARAALFVVNRAPVDLMNLDGLYQNELKRFSRQKTEAGEDFPELGECQRIERVEPVQCTSQKEAARRLQSLLNSLKLAPSDPILLCLQSNQPTGQLLKDFPSLRAFPTVHVRSNEPLNLMNVLDWANALARRSIQHFFNCFAFLKEYWSQSMYMEIPVGNLAEDLPSFAMDVLFARQLQAKHFLLWATPSAAPDFGGKDLEDLRLANDWDWAAFSGAEKGGEQLVNTETFEAQSLTAELSLGAVAVTALLQSARVSEAEGGAELAGFSAQNAPLSIEDALSQNLSGLTKYNTAKYYFDAVSVSGELRCLREIFHRLIRDIHFRRSVIADQLVINMHRWVCDPQAVMFSPDLRDALCMLMRKLCLLLVAEVQALGATVIHCSFTRLVLNTNRSTLPQAQAFLDSLLPALSQKPLFASLQISVRHCSSLLLWIDSANFAHVFASEQPGTDGRVECRFAMASRLPEQGGVRKNFGIMVAGFLGMLSKKRKELADQFDEDAFTDFAQRMLSEEIMESLFKLITRLTAARQRLKAVVMELGCTDVALEFVECTCRVLGTNTALEEQLRGMRAQLLLIVQQDGLVPKSALTEWMPPSRLLLENVFCPRCSQSADLDVGQKQQQGNAEMSNSSASSAPLPLLCCPHCSAKYPLNLVEEMLIERIAKMQTAFVLQDWRCRTCKKIGANFLSRHCDCNNAFEGTIRAEEFQHNLALTKRVAKKHGMEGLEHVVDHVLQCYSCR